MTQLSVNLNKIALLRNSRGRNYPNVLAYAHRLMKMGVKGITVHPRQDERHITRNDTIELSQLIKKHRQVEFNVEGYPSQDFLALIEQTRPDQCTLVPDASDQLTSDHGWQVLHHEHMLREALQRIEKAGVRAALFVDPDPAQVNAASMMGYQRVELYTESFARSYQKESQADVSQSYCVAKDAAIAAQMGVNAGHDLDLQNLSAFLAIGGILEVSIGHALIVESIDVGMESVVKQYLEICADAP